MRVLHTSIAEEALTRNHLAQLCKGFLVLQSSDIDRARQFLTTFLVESSKSST
jgi:hypothetical protein